MPATAETISLGLPVAIDRIDRELKKLWSEGEGAMTRASLMNLAVYSEEPESLTRNTRLLARITENHACRAIVIGADPRAKNDRMEAWISAHCHLSRAGTKRVCSEQKSFLLEGAMVNLLPSLVLSRLAFAQFFYHPGSHHHFHEIENGSIIFGNEFRSAAILFVGWLAAQLGWEIRNGKKSNQVELENSAGKPIRINLQEKGDVPIASFTAQSHEIEFQVMQADCGDLLEVCRGKLGEAQARQVLPSSENDPVKLMSEELMRGGPHHVYLRAVEKVRTLL